MIRGESSLTKVQQTGVTKVHCQTKRTQCVGSGEYTDELTSGEVKNLYEIHLNLLLAQSLFLAQNTLWAPDQNNNQDYQSGGVAQLVRDK